MSISPDNGPYKLIILLFFFPV